MELFSTQSLLLFFFSILIFLYLYLQSLTTNKTKGFKIYPLLGCLPEFLMNRHRFLDWSTQVLRECPTNSAIFIRPGNVRGVITANPANVEHMLKTNFGNYPKGNKFIYILGDFLGTGIFNADGELWRMQRKTASYEFNTKSLRSFAMENVTLEMRERLVPILSRAAEANRIVDLQDVLERFAFDNVCKLAFNVDPGCLGGDGTAGAEFMAAFENATVLSQGRFLSALAILWKLNRIFNLGTERMLRESIATVHEFADKIIRSRLEAGDPTANVQELDLLSRFIGTEDCSPEFLRYIVISFILAGRDTTSAALSWFFWITSSRPDVREKIRNEIETVRSAKKGESETEAGKAASFGYDYEELKQMHYLQAAISETMRLYPPVPVDTKSCLNDDVLPDGTKIGKDWFLSYHTYAMGRMVSVWGEDCEEFKPERWLDGGGVCRSESPFKFPVFHAGPRLCLGKEMAYIQMKYIAASVMERFEIEALDKDTCPEHILALTLRMKRGLPVKVRVIESQEMV